MYFYILTSIPLFLFATSNQVISSIDPDRFLTIGALIESRGFKHEPHHVTTKDGYILGIHRMMNPLSKKYIKGSPKTVVIQCGLLCSGTEFLLNSKSGKLDEDMIIYRGHLDQFDFKANGNNLGFLLANLGYDVWFFHPRGNFHSRNHTTRDPDSDKLFWDFTFDEMALIDLPTTFDYIMEKTEQTYVGYIGYSQGGTTIFALLADQPQYSEKIVPIIAIAPAVRIDNYAGNSADFLTRMIKNRFPKRRGECFPFHDYGRSIVCNGKPLTALVCQKFNENFLFANKYQVDRDRSTTLVSHMPSGTSCLNILHFLQLIKNKKFAKFDYGKDKNLGLYHSIDPPLYDLSKVKSDHIYLVYSTGDKSTNIEDIELFKSLLTSAAIVHNEIIQDDTFDHLDYFMSKNTGKLVNAPIAKMLKEYNH